MLGEILVEQGKLTRLELANALSEHWASFTTDSVSPPEHKPSLTVVPPANGSAPSPGAPDTAELRRSLDELEAARVADAQAAEARIAAIDEALAALVPSDDEEFRHAMTERLAGACKKVEAAESGSTGAVDLVAQLDDLASSTLELRSELEVLASRPAEVDSSERVSELKQTVDVLAKTLDDRLATLATELRAENDTRTDEIAARLRAQTEELAASVAVSRVDDLDEAWRADADAARLANDELQEKLDELMAIRATDVEATQAAHAQATHAAAETARIEHALRSELEALASLQAEAEQGESVVELKQAIDSISTQLTELAERVESSRAADVEAAESANGHLRERLDELIRTPRHRYRSHAGSTGASDPRSSRAARIEHALRSELETLAFLQAEAEPDESVNEVKQAIHALAQTTDERLAALATELRAETATRTEHIAGQLRAQTDELIALRTTDLETTQAAQARAAAEAARIEQALRSELEALASFRVDHEPDERVNELAQTVDALTRKIDDRLETIATELRAETERVESSRAADAEAAESANGHLRERLDELIALRATDIEATQAAHEQATHAAAETARIEHALRCELKQTIDVLPQGIDDRLESITTELRAEFATRTDDIATELRALTERVESSRAADAKVVKSASGQIHGRLDELSALRATDIEATRAAQAQADHAVAETARMEHTLRSQLEKLDSLQAEADPDELEQTISALAQLQAETADELESLDRRPPRNGRRHPRTIRQNADAWVKHPHPDITPQRPRPDTSRRHRRSRAWRPTTPPTSRRARGPPSHRPRHNPGRTGAHRSRNRSRRTWPRRNARRPRRPARRRQESARPVPSRPASQSVSTTNRLQRTPTLGIPSRARSDRSRARARRSPSTDSRSDGATQATVARSSRQGLPRQT